MKISLRSKNCNDGFTLIEVIITLVLISVFGAMLFSYFGSSITRSSEPITHLKQAYELKTVVENMTAYYLGLPSVDLNTLKDEFDKPNKYTIVTELKSLDTDVSTDNQLIVTVKDDSGISISVLFVTK
jgi:prepilin-type N-terminal cleavage/methylation domain-containing protein